METAFFEEIPLRIALNPEKPNFSRKGRAINGLPAATIGSRYAGRWSLNAVARHRQFDSFYSGDNPTLYWDCGGSADLGKGTSSLVPLEAPKSATLRCLGSGAVS